MEVNGQTIRTVIDGSAAEELAKRYLEEQGIKNPQPGEWYPQQAWLDTFKEIAENLGDAVLREIGHNIPEDADWPPEVNTVIDGLKSIDKAYHMNHRNGKIGHYKFEKTGKNKGKMICDTPYPNKFEIGLIEATAWQFTEDKLSVNVEIDETQPNREEGAESTTFKVEW